MVKFILKTKDDKTLIYEYFPEGDFESKAGIISLDTKLETISVEVPAEKDFLCSTTAKELNEMRDAVNQMRIENGEPELTENELPIATEDESWYWYGDHAVNRIWKAFCEGKELSEGTVMWY